VTTPRATLVAALFLSGVVAGCGPTGPEPRRATAGDPGSPDDDTALVEVDTAPQVTGEEPQPDPEPIAALDPRVEKAVRIAAAIEADPVRADEVLAAEGLDREQLDALMYEIARNAELARAYQEQRVGG
jgi:hypothetical protein